ncbi:MAG: hypothetical protein UT24_C0015G0005 [Candidatus Woesebacteria bacterium GW2011_GWB1_39_12]|uniref:Uncharacterized protein n=1 Tax=Candidatus Woesebacteria bacterium GW2011_GWB1_39_12 TaxID=1618574 RepID=A0A0G0QER3_9BACT|nr:MAG: hypothetical protein UT24_C0015G0005 [Candidatus Woesebacteria bacterium GW2011_GWB1_39_12]
MFKFIQNSNRRNEYGFFYTEAELEQNGFFSFLIGLIAGIAVMILIAT